jgi:invasion protein IalB
MCQACTPGVTLLTRSATEHLDFPNSSSDRAEASVPLTNGTTTLFKNGTILTLAHDEFSPAAALVVRDDTIIYGA